jgi:gamma-glutamylputrescine oxidase
MFGGGRPIYRASKDDRLAGQMDIAEPKLWRRQKRDFAHAFPALPDARIEKQWAGTIGMTLDELPMIGELAAESSPPAADSPAGGSGIYFVGGWSGHGVHLATASGAMVADLLAGRLTHETELAWHRNHAPRVPGDPLRTAGLSMYLSGLELADRLEAVLDRVIYGKIATSLSQSPAACVQA